MSELEEDITKALIFSRIATELCSQTHQAVSPLEFDFRFSSTAMTS